MKIKSLVVKVCWDGVAAAGEKVVVLVGLKEGVANNALLRAWSVGD